MAVVYYNALILSEALAELESRRELASTEVPWQHINFYGRYQFACFRRFGPKTPISLPKTTAGQSVLQPHQFFG